MQIVSLGQFACNVKAYCLGKKYIISLSFDEFAHREIETSVFFSGCV